MRDTVSSAILLCRLGLEINTGFKEGCDLLQLKQYPAQADRRESQIHRRDIQIKMGEAMLDIYVRVVMHCMAAGVV